ncbi:TlyA family RNA methyltransferase [Gilvimarinus sp. 1_MG-2023]|uniref:TlyA family RNA methyltransferase n=1 Tax=Gilvimarinus sp. 1_MG-2023 TaxID=3062638 RepID=UPI0026E33A73|nr:TlyA family RNA methyltransferase [Gilvimarinus sp. 1_MG-2023]MDO6747482.1 TlyA family RNA methyltransferase [Gilvimarinus sp. 1_MG-2023]
MDRLDTELVVRGLARSRAHAQKLIKNGCVSDSNTNLPLTKPSQKIEVNTPLTVTATEEDRYVSRGGLKLEGALQHTGIKVSGVTALDVGQSTGGFSDCLLQAGVNAIVGVDVGHDQLSQCIREDTRVTVYEGINARALPLTLRDTHSAAGFDLAVMDVSFISQTLIYPSLAPLLAPGGYLLSLVKPQFEVGREGIGKGGIVRDASLYKEVQAKIKAYCQANQLQAKDYFDSPIKGGDGNREFFVWAQKGR